VLPVASPDKLRVMLQTCMQLSVESSFLPVVVIAAETRTDLLFFEEWVALSAWLI
jgi:hypothetical protein